ncbi:MAG TPA: class I SAM-dependent methyltransferase [Candidatus Altiarchaeales archaeon]|nr:class I SAM-dependent methyltransferase [Candidatus Altiarchaeales archaeon]
MKTSESSSSRRAVKLEFPDSKRIVKNLMVLDVASGSGSGFWGREASHEELKKRLKSLSKNRECIDFDVVGVDVDFKQLMKGVSKGRMMAQMDARKLGFSDGSFDIVTCFNPETTFFVKSIIPEVKRVLKPEGFFLLSPWQSDFIKTHQSVLEENGFKTDVLEDKGMSKFIFAKLK